MPAKTEYETAMDEIKTMDKDELLRLQMKIDHTIRERRLKDVIFYFNNFADEEAVNNHAKAAYDVLCKKLHGMRQGDVLDAQLDIIEVLVHLD